jgi:lipoprotein signal peptidase
VFNVADSAIVIGVTLLALNAFSSSESTPPKGSDSPPA